MNSQLRELDSELTRIGQRVHVLGAISWPAATIEAFLRRPDVLPAPPAPPQPDPGLRTAMVRIAERAPREDPIGAFLAATATSYVHALDLVHGAGTAEAYAASKLLYGGAGDRLPGTELSYEEAAGRILAVTADLEALCRQGDDAYSVDAERVAAIMRDRFAGFFGPSAPVIELDPDLAAKASASAKRVRLRAGTSFRVEDVEQLVQHEGFVHAATSLNGRLQPRLTALSLAAPRTTATQEGLATFAELITGSMDLSRLRRLALRVVAVGRAEQGADFIEIVRFFRSGGQSPRESALSAARIFRGGDVRGRHVFTKDCVYLRGLFGVHTFLHAAIAERRPALIQRLFVGRLTLEDAMRLDSRFEDGTIENAKFMPPWVQNVRVLAASLAFSLMFNQIDLNCIDPHALWS